MMAWRCAPIIIFIAAVCSLAWTTAHTHPAAAMRFLGQVHVYIVCVSTQSLYTRCTCLAVGARDQSSVQVKEATERVIAYVRQTGLLSLNDGEQLVVVSRRTLDTGRTLDDQRLGVRAFIVGDLDAVEVPHKVRPCCLKRVWLPLCSSSAGMVCRVTGT